MNKISLYIISICLIISFISCGNKQKETDDILPDKQLSTVAYVPSQEIFPNPERGFYKQFTGYGDNSLSSSTLKGLRKENISLILRLYYFKDFRNNPLNDAMLQYIQKDMDILRESGMKAILRFAYSESIEEPDAPLSIILEHLEQLKPIFQKNTDVIAALQAGFIGSWGEWYYTTNNLNNDQARKEILDKILEVLPVDRFVQVRTPEYKRKYIGTSFPISEEQAFTNALTARIGHHNDCFMASPDDYGTYTDVVKDKEYLNTEGLYAPMGGETCPPSGIEPADCEKAQNEMRKLRWSYLNQDYYKGVLDNWVLQGCMENIIRDMGYRISLIKGDFSNQHTPGSDFTFILSLQNLGYAPFYNARNVELILKSDNNTYVAKLPEDPRFWQPYKPIKLEANIALPSNIPSGKYKLYLFLPAPESTIHDRPEYAVRLANNDCWDEETGYNDLNYEVLIEDSLDLPISTSTLKFLPKK